ncbi:MAG: hypothetical protein JO359_02855, partial [Candidatus Eremiobacteraeota bacterium]|nr:hypothetical protein [Candidatus Eremiobacteraeota bacterium]
MRGLVTFAAAVAGLSLLPVNAAAQTPSALPSSLHLPKAAPATLWITPEFTPGKQIPKKFAMKECGGENASPRLTWKGAPKATKSFVVTFTDSTMDNAYHWIVADIPSTTKALPSNVEIGQNPAYGR